MDPYPIKEIERKIEELNSRLGKISLEANEIERRVDQVIDNLNWLLEKLYTIFTKYRAGTIEARGIEIKVFKFNDLEEYVDIKDYVEWVKNRYEVELELEKIEIHRYYSGGFEINVEYRITGLLSVRRIRISRSLPVGAKLVLFDLLPFIFNILRLMIDKVNEELNIIEESFERIERISSVIEKTFEIEKASNIKKTTRIESVVK